MSTLGLAAAQYPIEFLGEWARFKAKLVDLIGDAAQAGARLLVFPEYGSMELASLFPAEVYGDLQLQIDRMQELLPQWLRFSNYRGCILFCFSYGAGGFNGFNGSPTPSPG